MIDKGFVRTALLVEEVSFASEVHSNPGSLGSRNNFFITN
jgi:hypothetical protein